MTEEQLRKSYMPIIEKMSKSRFMLLLYTVRYIVFKNSGIIDIYKAQDRYEKIKISLVKHKKLKNKDLYNEDLLKLQQMYGKGEDFDKILLRRYDFLIDLFLVFNESTFDITDIDGFIKNADSIYEEYYKERFEKQVFEKLRQYSKNLIS